MSRERDPYKTNDRRVIPWLLLGLVVLFGGAYVAAYAAAGDRVPRGASVGGVEIGGLTPAAARADVGRQPRRHPGRARSGRCSGDPRQDQARAGRARRGRGGLSRPGRRRPLVGPHQDLGLPDRGRRLRRRRHRRRRAAGRGRGQVRHEGRHPGARRTRRVQGRHRDRPSAVAPARCSTGRPRSIGSPPPTWQACREAEVERIELPTATQDPKIGRADVSVAMDSFANPAVSGPVKIELEDEQIVLRPVDFVPALSMTVQDGDLVPVLDDELLLEAVESRMEGIALAAKDATVELRNGRPASYPPRGGSPSTRTRSSAGSSPSCQHRRRPQPARLERRRQARLQHQGRPGPADRRAGLRVHDELPPRRLPQHQPGSGGGAGRRHGP